MFSKIGTKSSKTHCTAPTGKGGKHCGKSIGFGRMSNGRTCNRNDCQLWHISKYM